MAEISMLPSMLPGINEMPRPTAPRTGGPSIEGGVGAGSPLKPGESSASFLDTLKGALNNANEAQLSADTAARDFTAGKGQDLHNVMLAMEKAEIAVRTVTAVRNKVVEAYQEIMRMPV